MTARRQFYQRRYAEEVPLTRAIRRQAPETEGQMMGKLEEESIKRRRRQNRRVRPKANRIPTMMSGNEDLG